MYSFFMLAQVQFQRFSSTIQLSFYQFLKNKAKFDQNVPLYHEGKPLPTQKKHILKNL